MEVVAIVGRVCYRALPEESLSKGQQRFSFPGEGVLCLSGMARMSQGSTINFRLDVLIWTSGLGQSKVNGCFHTVSAEKWNMKCLRCGCSNIVACGMALSSGRPIAYKGLMAEVALQENRTTTWSIK